jgi:hypothetical protein
VREEPGENDGQEIYVSRKKGGGGHILTHIYTDIDRTHVMVDMVIV